MQELINTLTELIKCRASNREGANAAIDYCAARLKKSGVSVNIHENAGYRMLKAGRGKGTGKTVILHGHVDVIPGEEMQFIPRIEGERLYGRGSYDMLGAVAVMLHLMERFVQYRQHPDVLLMLVPDEEVGSNFGTPFLIEQGYTGGFVISGEPTNLDISLQAKGVLHLEAEVKGVSAHGSRPWLGENAIEKAMSIYLSIKELPFNRVSNDYFPAPSLNLATINGGKVFNQVPDSCSFGLDIRYLPGQNPEEIIEEIKRVSEDMNLKRVQYFSPVSVDRQHPFVQALFHAVAKFSRDGARFFGQDGSGDTRFFTPLGIPAVEFGPCGAGHHGKEEFVVLPSLLEYEKILLQFFNDYLS